MYSLLVILTVAGALPDRGIFPELLARVNLATPRAVDPARDWLRIDRKHAVATLYDGDDPLALYVLGRDTLPDVRVIEGAPGRDEDRDGDGIVDRLDVLLGAKKLLYNGARYVERYVSIPYPNGDVPRGEGVCSDTVIRALRNAGLDLQREVHEDILRAPRAYPMVEKVDASINHRRVRTLLPWFVRHWQTLPRGASYLPGDVVFFDTFPQRDGPDHLGVVADDVAPSGRPYVINNWTEGATDAEMDLLSWVPVTHHFRWSSGGKSHAR
jgi:uncharacterized protein YijF (DUF1287 family)